MKHVILFMLISVAFAKKSGKVEKSWAAKSSMRHQVPPPSVTVVTRAASKIAPTLKSDFRIIAGITESSPTFDPVESIIQNYVKSHYATVSLLEYYDKNPSAIVSFSKFSKIKCEFPTLATAVSALVSEELTHESLSDIQSTLQSVMVQYPTIVSAGDTSFAFSYAYLRPAESGISKAELTVPRIVTDVEALRTFLAISPSLSSALDELAVAGEYYTTALRHMTKAQDWTQQNAWRVDKTLKSIESCYKTLYDAITSIEQFIASHSSASSAFENVVQVLPSVPSILSDVSSFISAVSTSFVSALTKLKPALQVDSHLTTEVTYLDLIEALHPSISCAQDTLDHGVHSHQSVVKDIEHAIRSPSLVTDTAYINSLEHRYHSIETAVRYIDSAEKLHQSLSFIESQLSTVEHSWPSVITLANEVISETSPSLIGDVSGMVHIKDISPTISSALRSLFSITKRVPSLSCDESIVAEYAAKAPSALDEIASAISSPSKIAQSSDEDMAMLTAEYKSLASALLKIHSVESKYPQLSTIESKIIFALTYEPSVIEVYYQLEKYSTIVSQEVHGFGAA